ncbi:MAG: hypothetical protein LBV69_10660 [Bacteroidales bacterium]|jgi:hypothetical protein|nr:hypothetical protein [Bacteroidales bacterium]
MKKYLFSIEKCLVILLLFITSTLHIKAQDAENHWITKNFPTFELQSTWITAK